ncbi:MAG: hypothetical protein P8Z50_04065, partial [candidate division WOR-3 bacterium]
MFIILFFLPFFLLGEKEPAQITIKKDLPRSLELNIEDCLTATITSPEPIIVYMVGMATEAGKGLVAKVTTEKFEIKSGVNRYDASRIPPIAETWIVPEYESLIERTGKLPEGRYTILIRLLSIKGELLDEDKLSHRVKYPELRLIAPGNGAEIIEPSPVFRWSITRPVPGARYVLKIFGLMPEQTEIAAVSEIPFFQRNTASTVFRYPLSARPLEEGKKYVWYVQVLDESGYPLGRVEGKSEIFSFNYKGKIKEKYTIKLVSPEGNAEIPFDQIKFCWEALPAGYVNYNVYYTHEDCDSSSEGSRAHPFAPLLPDSASQSRILELQTRKRNLEVKLEYWRRYCGEEVLEMLESSMKNQEAWEEAKEQLETMAQSLRGELDFSLSDNCPIEEHCCNNRPCCEGLDPCNEADLETYKERIRCLHGQIN